MNDINVYKINCILFVVDSQFYESWAFMRDQERSSMMPMMAAGEFPFKEAIKREREVSQT